MSAGELRKVLLRAVLDGEFFNLLSAAPEEALKDYTLTDDEKAMLTSPTIALLDKTRVAGDLSPYWVWFFIMPAVTDAVATLTDVDKEKVAQLVRDIRNTAGRERFDMIMDLVHRVQLEDQIPGDPRT